MTINDKRPSESCPHAVRANLLPTNDWRNWKIKGCVRDGADVLRLVIEDWQGNQWQVMAVEAPDWQPLATVEKGSEVCPVHGEPWVTPDAPDGSRRCTFYVPELGASEDYGCPQPTDTKGSYQQEEKS
jgi:hypothetical protein